MWSKFNNMSEILYIYIYIYISLLKFPEIGYEIKLEEENEHIYPTPNTRMINCLQLVSGPASDSMGQIWVKDGDARPNYLPSKRRVV